MCNSEECLFDGFDCDGSNSTCQIADHCLKRFNNGFCDTECNNSACGYDGGDCEKAVEATVSLWEAAAHPELLLYVNLPLVCALNRKLRFARLSFDEHILEMETA